MKVNFPEDKNELIDKASAIIAKILVTKLQPKEINELIDLLEKDTICF